MSNRRRPRAASRYGYMRSDAWKARRRHWHAEQERRTGKRSQCEVCFTERKLDLHHLDYSGVIRLADNTWNSLEKHEDLVPLCRRHHEAVHRLLDNDTGYRDHMSRRAASLKVIAKLRQRVLDLVVGLGDAVELQAAP